MILAGRRINDAMAQYIAITYIKEIIQKGLKVRGETLNFLGFTFKEDTPDLRNTKMMDLINEFKALSMQVNVHDPLADKNEAKTHYGIDLVEQKDMPVSDFLVLAVAHTEYKNNKASYLKMLSEEGIVCDIKGLIEAGDLTEKQSVWRL
jgi:UDP-N-acetyl-D-galactosamine dehydrogenase